MEKGYVRTAVGHESVDPKALLIVSRDFMKMQYQASYFENHRAFDIFFAAWVLDLIRGQPAVICNEIFAVQILDSPPPSQ